MKHGQKIRRRQLCELADREDKDKVLIDSVSRDDFVSNLGTTWRGVSDRVMGGVSQQSLCVDEHYGRRCLRLCGDVRLDNNGGFIQMALDLDPHGGPIDATAFAGVRLVVLGNSQRYSVHLRTTDVERSWQSYRAHFQAEPQWQVIGLPFDSFVPHRLDAPLDTSALRRIGVVAIGRAFHADLCLATIELYT